MDVAPGFKQSELGAIPEDWQVAELGRHVSFRTGPFGSALHQSDYVHGGVPLVNPQQICDGKIVPSPAMAIPERLARTLGDFRLAVGNIVIGRRGEMGRCAVVREEEDGWLCGTGSMILRTGPTVDAGFLQRVLSSPSVIAAIESGSVGTTMVNLNQGTLSNLGIPLPPTKAEQEAIAEALSDADALIESLEQLIAKKRQIKQGAMQELLTGKRRLPGFETKRGTKQTDVGEIPLDWSLFRQGQVVKFINGRAYAKHEWETTGTPVCRLQNLTGSGETFYYSNLQLPDKQYMVDGDLIFMWSATFGPYVWRGERTIFHYHIWKIECDEGLADKGFYYHKLVELTERLKLTTSGSTMLHLTKSGMEQYWVALPSVEEQRAIAAVLSDMNVELEALDTKLTKAQQIKHGMMHNLLTGRIRLV